MINEKSLKTNGKVLRFQAESVLSGALREDALNRWTSLILKNDLDYLLSCNRIWAMITEQIIIASEVLSEDESLK